MAAERHWSFGPVGSTPWLALVFMAVIGCAGTPAAPVAQHASIAPVSGRCEVFGGCEAVPQLPACDCYLNNDCGWTGLWVCMTTPNTCTVNFQPSGKINDGLCTFFAWARLADPEQRMLASRAYAGFIDAFVAAGRSGGPPDAGQLLAARSLLTGDAAAGIETLAAHTVVLIVGRAEYHDDYPHAAGAFHYPRAEPIAGDPSRLRYALARIDRLDEPTLAMLKSVGAAVAEYLASPDNTRLRSRLDALARDVPGYRSRGACEHPHPAQHRHHFEFTDGYDCLAAEILHAVSPLEALIRERGAAGSRR